MEYKLAVDVLVIGGAGFIGCNVASHHARSGRRVVVFDNLSRKGSALNLSFLKKRHRNVFFQKGDIRNPRDLARAFKNRRFDVVYLLAAQVAVTTSVENPREDFEINALGTFNVLEAMRQSKSSAILLYASTNKVYGGMEDIVIVKKGSRYQYRDYPKGITEARQLDFHSPYGCSKGAGEQYVRDYSRIYGLRTVVFRQSCIYGYRQFGVEDQGWVAWFAIAAAFGSPLTIFGDGKQTRDVLFIDDLIECYESAVKNIDKTNGQAYNIGGGAFQMSLLDLLKHLERLSGRKIKTRRGPWRPGDQRVFISDTAKARRHFGWSPKTSPEDGVKKLFGWISKEKDLFRKAGLKLP